MNILRKLNKLNNILLTEHARVRLIERGILVSDIQSVIINGEIIKQYEDDSPFPSCLVLGLSVNNKYLHIVVSTDNEYIYLITAYFPEISQWNDNFKTKRR